MTINNIIEMFFNRVPEIKNKIDVKLKENSIDMTDGIYVTWGMGVMPCVIDTIYNYKDTGSQLEKVFMFFEEMANADEDIKDLLMYSTLEKLGDEKQILEIAYTYMGKETRILSDRVEAFLGR